MITLLFHHLDDEILGCSKEILMFSLEIVLLGIALAIDAAVVTFAISLVHLELSATHRVRRGFLISLAFGIFQALMLWLGSYAGYLFTFSSFGYFFQIGIGIIFFGLAFKFIQESMTLDEKKLEWGLLPVIILAFATSIDAMASGVSLGTIPRPYLAATEVGLITFFICGSFYFMGQFFRKIPDRWLLRFAAAIFVFLGVQVFWGIRHYILRG
jgi:putative Mn2+ efflux pump MntP